MLTDVDECSELFVLTDVDECTESLLQCSHTCVNVPGSAYCACPIGYVVDTAGTNCDGESLPVNFSNGVKLLSVIEAQRVVNTCVKHVGHCSDCGQVAQLKVFSCLLCPRITSHEGEVAESIIGMCEIEKLLPFHTPSIFCTAVFECTGPGGLIECSSLEAHTA